ncbi:acyl-CoA dehydrogenase [Bradymonas sediminis]|uniref:Short/branched chain specific acyl-CoA dehydrogenase, mitochondrial n=1 Tax=Bradymonas sediminis TaxID=1548548 RepID=A0A2Z4FLU2_9DELT|nr:acyl-CoA dehydrogenase [Bradymonas sediminis]AWV89949.1 acyl-CoA dehydrogenase [Bradymonas sediminis]TDP62170.1 butyryl-CoA dehydrogenase [Bradymonas sediminis]
MTNATHPALTKLSEEEKMFRDAVATFARKEVAPRVQKMDHDQVMDKAILDQAFELGLMGIEVPEEYGGAGSSFFNAILAVEELAKVDPSVSVVIDVQNTLVNNAILRWGNEDQKKKYFPKMCSEWVGAYALSEPGSGSDAFALATKAEDCGDHWKLNGNKLWITNGKEASLYIVLANVNPEAGYRGITAFLVERDFEGFSVGKKEDKLGIRASSTVELIMENCIVPKENVLGEIGKGYKVAIETLNEGRIGIGAQMIGLAQGAFDLAMNYMMEREQFGKPIAHFQGLQFQYAQLASEIEAARLMVYNAARIKDAGEDFTKAAAMAKLISSQVAERVASKCVEFHGGVGFTKEFGAEKFFRDAKIGSIYEGTTNMQLQTIAKLLLDERG